jgi:hypothetical protein
MTDHKIGPGEFYHNSQAQLCFKGTCEKCEAAFKIEGMTPLSVDLGKLGPDDVKMQTFRYTLSFHGPAMETLVEDDVPTCSTCDDFGWYYGDDRQKVHCDHGKA